MMPIIALSTTESELFLAVLTTMDMVFAYHIMISLGLHVKLLMILCEDNTGAVGLANNCSIGGCTRHVDVKQNYLCELKEQGFLHIKHKKGTKIIADVRTKNLSVQDY